MSLTPREAITLSLTEGREVHTSLPGALQPLAVLCDDYHSDGEGATVFTGTHEGRTWCVKTNC